MSTKFPTDLWERALERRRARREQLRQELLHAVSDALAELSRQIVFTEAYIFGSLTRPERFSEESDIDIAFVGLRDEDFFKALAFLSDRLGRDLDLVQLEKHPHKAQIIREGIPWTKPAGPS